MKRFWAWVLIILSYLTTFGVPIVGAYYFLAVDRVKEEGRGGIFYLTMVSIFLIVMLITLIKAVDKMEANLFKSIFKMALRVGIALGLVMLVKFVDLNEAKLINFLYTLLGGMFLGSLIETIAVSLYGKYIREVGAF
jgi:hypothetical protein